MPFERVEQDDAKKESNSRHLFQLKLKENHDSPDMLIE